MLIIASGIVLVQYLMNRSLRHDLKMQYENFYQELNERDKQIVLKNEKQLKQFYPEVAKMIDSLGIKHVREIQQTEYHYSSDTIITVLVPADAPGNFTFELDTMCLQISGLVDVNNQLIYHNKISLNDKVETFYYRQRGRLFGWSWTPKWGKWQNKALTHSNCTDSITTTNIKIEND
jgi:hypothetical protein